MSASEVDNDNAKFSLGTCSAKENDPNSSSPPPTTSEASSQQKQRPSTTIHHLPQEVLEHIFAMVSPYRDFKSVMLTCSWWRRIMRGVADRCAQEFFQSVKEGNVRWKCVRPGDAGEEEEDDDVTAAQRLQRGEIIERYSHCAAYLECSLYVFGGCTSSNTTFNDLWRFDLASRQWIRPLAMGTYPSPKACATMVTYLGTLILFGGYTHPTPYPLHQAARFFNQLHIYDPATNRWSTINTVGYSPPPIAGHSASVIGDRMIVFGGSHGQGSRTNEVWVLDLVELTWSRRDIFSGRQPDPRYGQTQITLDDQNILIIGGCGGANMLFSDVWLLDMSEESSWRWVEMAVENADSSTALQLWCHPACKVGDVVVILGKSEETTITTSVRPSPMRMPRTSRQPGRHNSGGDHPHNADPPSSAPPSLEPSYLNPRSQPHVHDDAGRTDQHPSLIASSSSSSSASSSSVSSARAAPAVGRRRTPPREMYTNRETGPRGRTNHHHHHNGGGGGSSSSDEGGFDPSLPSTSNDFPTHRPLTSPSRFQPLVASPPPFSNPLATTPHSRPPPPPPSSNSNAAPPPPPHHRGPSIRPNAHNDRQKQLEMLRRMEQRIRRLTSGPQGVSHATSNGGGGGGDDGGGGGGGEGGDNEGGVTNASSSGGGSNAMDTQQSTSQNVVNTSPRLHQQHQQQQHEQQQNDHQMQPQPHSLSSYEIGRVFRSKMKLHTLDVSQAIDQRRVCWTSFEDTSSSSSSSSPTTAPDETIFYSLVEGRGELLLFGGLLGGPNAMSPHGLSPGNLQTVTNKLWTVSARSKLL